MSTRAEILDEAKKCVCGQREHDYGSPENNFETIGLLWATYLRAAHPELAKVLPLNGINGKDVAIMMAQLKIARIASGSSPDSFVDLAGYAACAGEIATRQKALASNDPTTGNRSKCVKCGASIPEGCDICLDCEYGLTRCVSCGDVIPEGRQVCPACESKNGKKDVEK